MARLSRGGWRGKLSLRHELGRCVVGLARRPAGRGQRRLARPAHQVGSDLPRARTTLHSRRILPGGWTIGAGVELGAKRGATGPRTQLAALAAPRQLPDGLGRAGARLDAVDLANG